MEGAIDLGNYPVIFCDEIGDIYSHAGMAHFLLTRWIKIEGVLRKIVVAEMIRPVGAIKAEQMRKIVSETWKTDGVVIQ